MCKFLFYFIKKNQKDIKKKEQKTRASTNTFNS